jgi:hypothetical protein
MRILHFSEDCRKADHMRLRSFKASLVIIAMILSKSAFGSQDASKAAEPDLHKSDVDAPPDTLTLTRASALVMFDYQAIKIKGYQPIDLMGFHFLNKFNDWLYLGVGGHAPLAKGDYGGFMAFDTTIHAERRLFGNLSAAVGASLGGGGGGKSTEQSKILSGSGGFIKSYIGLGYQFNDISVGVNYSKIRFTNSVINGSQLGLYVQAPFSYSIAPYESAGRRLSPSQESSQSDDDVFIFGLDNIIQINPKGSNKRTVNLVDAQYNHFLTENYYLLFGGSVGYHGIAGYNQAYGGIGYKYSYSDRSNTSLQLALGSGGYSPEKIDTGSGLLIYPKLSTEYRLSNNFGLSLSGGYLYAPRGSSRNMTLGAALVYHASPGGGSAPSDQAANELAYRGHRFHTFLQTQFKVKVGDQYQRKLKLLSVQIDNMRRDNTYIPIQGSIAYDSYLGYPGYGEVLAGIGVQNKYSADDAFQTFAQLLVGTNIHGIIMKPAMGVNYGLNDGLAIYAQAGSTLSLDSVGLYPKKYRFRSTSVGLGLSYRFSLLR